MWHHIYDLVHKALINAYFFRISLILCRYPFTPDQHVQEADWEIYLRETAQQIVEQQTPKRYRSSASVKRGHWFLSTHQLSPVGCG